jgi:hypothetical protein
MALRFGAVYVELRCGLCALFQTCSVETVQSLSLRVDNKNVDDMCTTCLPPFRVFLCTAMRRRRDIMHIVLASDLESN